MSLGLTKVLQLLIFFSVQAALRCPNSITAPLKLFKEQEVLRNDAILLLQCIVFESKVAQDVAVREGCLDLLFEIYQYAFESIYIYIHVQRRPV